MNKRITALCSLLVLVALMASASTVRADTFPSTPFNGLQITYNISGADLGTPNDTESSIGVQQNYGGSTLQRDFTGTLSGSTLTVSGTVSGVNDDWMGEATVGVDGNTDSKSLSGSAGSSESFTVSVSIPTGAQEGMFHIEIEYSTVGSSQLIVETTTPPGLSPPQAGEVPVPWELSGTLVGIGVIAAIGVSAAVIAKKFKGRKPSLPYVPPTVAPQPTVMQTEPPPKPLDDALWHQIYVTKLIPRLGERMQPVLNNPPDGCYIANATLPSQIWNNIPQIGRWIADGYLHSQAPLGSDAVNSEDEATHRAIENESNKWGQCGEAANWAEKWYTPMVKEIFGDDAVITQIKIGGDILNHVANLIILPNGDRFVLDNWKSMVDRPPSPFIVPEAEWDDWARNKFGLGGAETTRDVNGDLERQLKDAIQAKNGNVKEGMEYLKHRFPHDKAIQTIANNYEKNPWNLQQRPLRVD